MFANLPDEIWRGDGEDLDDEFLDSIADHIKHLMDHCHWFEDHERFLYIVDDDACEIHGPDNEMAELIDEAWCWAGDDSPRTIASRISESPGVTLSFIPVVLRRFDSVTGFYHA